MNDKIDHIDPTTVYASPAELLDAKDISKDEKIKLLHDWEYTLRQVLVAEEENIVTNQTVDLQDVLDALKTISDEPLDTGSSKI